MCGLALLCTCSYLLGLLLSSIFGSSPSIAHYFPLVFWLLAAGIFWAVDRSRLESGVTQTVTLNTYTPPPVMASAAAPTQAAAPAPQYATRPFTPGSRCLHSAASTRRPSRADRPGAPEPIYVAPAPPRPCATTRRPGAASAHR